MTKTAGNVTEKVVEYYLLRILWMIYVIEAFIFIIFLCY